MIYFVSPSGDTATAETEARAAWLEAHGYLRCTEARWRTARQARDLSDIQRILPEDWLELQNTPAPAVALPWESDDITPHERARQ